MRELVFTDDGWEDYVYWQNHDKKLLKKVNMLLKDTQRNPFIGLGKPEPLKGELSGSWSRRIDASNRLIYLATDNHIRIMACRHHYE